MVSFLLFLSSRFVLLLRTNHFFYICFVERSQAQFFHSRAVRSEILLANQIRRVDQKRCDRRRDAELFAHLLDKNHIQGDVFVDEAVRNLHGIAGDDLVLLDGNVVLAVVAELVRLVMAQRLQADGAHDLHALGVIQIADAVCRRGVPCVEVCIENTRRLNLADVVQIVRNMAGGVDVVHADAEGVTPKRGLGNCRVDSGKQFVVAAGGERGHREIQLPAPCGKSKKNLHCRESEE